MIGTAILLGIVAIVINFTVTTALIESPLFKGYRSWIVKEFGAESLLAYAIGCYLCTGLYVGLFTLALLAVATNHGPGLLLNTFVVWAARLLSGALFLAGTTYLLDVLTGAFFKDKS